jgi:hypothetical protein
MCFTLFSDKINYNKIYNTFLIRQIIKYNLKSQWQQQRREQQCPTWASMVMHITPSRF